ncbi:hypothetical protein V5E97_26885 [Singulisphaera sp. Ch08]|uniref:Uncharacterized protein n=1 Tax=Singulisphaera sp. Ch08 TaxID=3120278 RepID=A0AAU7C957_9BACT
MSATFFDRTSETGERYVFRPTFTARGWKVKIQEKERLEPPHVTVWHGERMWRIGLRNRDFIVPPGGSWKEIDDEVRVLIENEDNWKELCEA